MKKYTIEDLMERFVEDTKKTQESNAFFLQEFKEKNPGITPPSYLIDEWYLSDALYSICEVIKRIEHDRLS